MNGQSMIWISEWIAIGFCHPPLPSCFLCSFVPPRPNNPPALTRRDKKQKNKKHKTQRETERDQAYPTTEQTTNDKQQLWRANGKQASNTPNRDPRPTTKDVVDKQTNQCFWPMGTFPGRRRWRGGLKRTGGSLRGCAENRYVWPRW